MSARPSETGGASAGHASFAGTGAGVMTGLLLGTRLATSMGWRPVEEIMPGDDVLTFDAGLQPVTTLNRVPIWAGEGPCPPSFWPLEVPPGALGNRDLLHIQPHQPMMLESNAAEELFGDPFILVPAMALADMRGIHAVTPRPDLEVVEIQFADDQVIFAESGALFFCSGSRDLLELAATGDAPGGYHVLPLDMARSLTRDFAFDFTSACGKPRGSVPVSAA
jgi:hypothetical protein